MLMPAFIRTSGNQIEQLVDREEWRQEAFGIPGLDNVAHPVTNPGVDTRMVSLSLRELIISRNG
jgi:hypothetical protein